MCPAAHLHPLCQLLKKKSLIPSPFLLQRLLAFSHLGPSRGQQATEAYNTHLHIHIMVGFLPGLGAPSDEMSSWGSSHKKIKICSSWCTDCFSKYTYGDTGGRYCFLLHPISECKVWPQIHSWNTNCILFLNHWAERERGKKKTKTKSVFLMWSCLKVYMGAILLYESLAKTLEHGCSEGEDINWSVVMKFPCVCFPQERQVSFGRS